MPGRSSKRNRETNVDRQTATHSQLKESCPLISFQHGERMQQTLRLEHRLLVLNTKILVLKMMEEPALTWAPIFPDRSAADDVKAYGGGILIKLQNRHEETFSKSLR